MRRWVRRLSWLLAASLLATGLGGAWLLYSEAGLRWTLARVQAAWPGLAVGHADGRLAGPLRLQSLRWKADGARLELSSLALEWSPAALLGGELQVERLQVGAITWQDSAAAPASTWPNLPALHWPQAAGPLTLRIDTAVFAGLRVDADEPLAQARIDHLRLDGQGLRMGGFEALGPWGRMAGSASPVAAGADLHGQLQPAQGLALDWRLRIDRAGLRAQFAAAETLKLDISGDAQAHWQAELVAHDFDGRAWWPALPAPLQGRLRLDAEPGALRLDGTWPSGPWPLAALELQASAVDAGTWRIDGARLQPVAGGQLRLQGRVPADPAAALDLHIAAEDLTLPAAAEGLRVGRAEASLRGPRAALELQIDAQLQRDGTSARLTADLALAAGAIDLRALALDTPQGQVQATGRFRPGTDANGHFDLQARAFDPAWLLPGEPGRIDADLALDLQQVAGQWQAQLQLDRLRGDWRGQPLDGQGRLHWQAPALPQGELKLRYGQARLDLRSDADTGLRAEVHALRLNPFGKDLHGELDGWLRLPDPAVPTAVEADLRFDRLALGELRLQQLHLQGGLAAVGDRRMQVRWSGLEFAGSGPGKGEISVQGAPADYRLSAQVEQGDWRGEASWRGAHDGGGGRLRELALALSQPRIGTWRLDAPVQVDYGDALRIAPGCLRSDAAALCVEAADGRFRLDLHDLPLQRVAAAFDLPSTLAIDGHVRGEAMLRLQGADWRPERIALDLDGGRVRDLRGEPLTLLGWRDAHFEAPWQAGQWQLQGRWNLDDDGFLDLDLRLPWEAAPDPSRLQGRLDLQIPRLQALALLQPDLVAPQGQLQGRLEWAAAGIAPAHGSLGLSGFSAAIPALGIRVDDARLDLFDRDGRWQVDGQLDTGAGIARLEGDWAPGHGAGPHLRIAGEDVQLAATPSLQLRASPALDLRWQAGVLQVRGSLGVGPARVDLERLEAGVQVSPDVVVLDPEPSSGGRSALPLDVDVAVALGDAVQLAGFGFDGGIAGKLRVREQPGRAAVGRGTLDLRGTYRAYGQDLEIERGRLLFAASALDNPGIDLRARRTLREVTVGIAVRGAARRPQLSLWSEPALDQAEALSYLVLGRPLRSASAADGAQLGQAAAAIGGNLLAAKIGGRLGFDTFGVADSSALGGAAFTVGKYLSPRLYLSYGVSLFDSSRAISLRYLFNSHLDVEIESARESRAGVNYRIESDHGPFRAAD